MSSMPRTEVLVVGAVLSSVLSIHYYNSSRHLPLPPGPHGVPESTVLNQYAYRTFDDWKQVYGPVYTVHTTSTFLEKIISFFFGSPPAMVVITGYEASVELMQRQSNALADRPRYIAASDILSRGMRLLMMPGRELHRKMRKEVQTQLKPASIIKYEPLQVRFARKLILDTVRNPSQHQEHAQGYAASIMLSSTYGKLTPTTYADEDVISINRVMARMIHTARPGTWKIERFPFLRYVPGYLSPLRRGHEDDLATFGVHLNKLRSKMVDNSDEIPECLGKSLLQRQAEHELSSNEMTYLAGGMFSAGSDTTAAAISTFILCAAAFPEEQATVQAELDTVIGQDRVPNFSDQELLPQLTAFIIETLRFRPVAPGGIPHAAIQDVIWNGYCIPKGTIVMGNHWSVCRDPTLYDDPDTFNPQRWLQADGTLIPDAGQNLYYYGFGRRVCPGRFLADKSIFITAIHLLWTFKISQDALRPIDVNAFEGFISSRPSPFEAVFTPRFASAVGLVESESEEANF